ncbi:ribosomal RNA small subunit methyltransferase A [bacterium]|nr:ribosomal RNA small subunit methyltransferase A [bacterium]
MNPPQLKKIFKELEFLPKKRLGQNFLINKRVVKKLLSVADLQNNEIVIEIGPGLGFITEELVKKCKKVIAIEIDRTLYFYLKKKFQGYNNLEIINKDALKIDFSSLNLKKYKIVGSLPYTSALFIIRKFLEEKNQPISITSIVQKEVAEKICSKKMSLPKAAIELYGKAKIAGYIPKKYFYPKPKVDGAILNIANIHPPLKNLDLEFFFTIIKAAFVSPRKTLTNNLKRKVQIDKHLIEEILKKMKLSANVRAENISLKQWCSLCISLKNML